MAHKTLINGTAYDIKGGRTLVNGTGYSIKQGKTCVNGTNYTVGFVKEYTETLSIPFSSLTNSSKWTIFRWGSGGLAGGALVGASSDGSFTAAHSIETVKSISYSVSYSGQSLTYRYNTPSYTINGKTIKVTYPDRIYFGDVSSIDDHNLSGLYAVIRITYMGS